MTSEGWVLIIAALGLALTQVITAWRTGNTVKVANEKLDVVVRQGNGLRTEMLQKIASLELMLSEGTGNTIRSDNAQQAANDSADRGKK